MTENKVTRFADLVGDSGKLPDDSRFLVAYNNFWALANELKKHNSPCPICGHPFNEHHEYLPDFECIFNRLMFHTDMEGGG